jgi:hypothetical protein
MRKLETATFEEVCDAIATSTFHEVVRIWLAKVGSNTDIATENQHICIVCVNNVDVTKFKM